MSVATAASAPTLGRQVVALLRPWRRSLLLVALSVVAAALVELVPPLVVGHVVDANLVPRRADGLLVAAVIYLGAVLADAMFTFVYSYSAASVAQRAIASLRAQLFAHVARLPISYFDRTPVGDVISRATADVETVDELFTDGIVTLIGQLVPLVAVAAAMVALSPTLTLVALVVAPPLIVIARFLQRRVRDAERDTRTAIGRLNTQLAETVSGVETIRAFGRERAFAARFRAALLTTLAAEERSTRFNSYFTPATNLLAALVLGALIWVGGGGVLASIGVGLGTLTAFILLFQRFFAPIVALGDEWQSVQAALAGAERVFEVLNLPVERLATGGGSAAGGGGIEVCSVSYGYSTELPVVDDVSLRVEPGEHVALVGRTGAGKSTLLQLVGGLYTPWNGKVRVAGRDPHALAEHERRGLLGVAPQTVQLFGGTLRENLTLGDTSIADAQLEHAVEVAGLGDVVAALPEGLETLLAGSGRGRGVLLSAGERQLVTLARALAAQPAVLLLDEATAAIDGASDATFRDALRRTALAEGCAILTIAHRLSTAREADRVVVMDAGRIVEQGSPPELLAQHGRFAALVELERAGWQWADDE